MSEISREEEERMAAEWAAMSGGPPAGKGGGGGGDVSAAMGMDGGSTRVLNQNEIDSLLGFADGNSRDRDTSGIRAIIDSGLVSYERLPMLEVVVDRLVPMMSTSLRNFASDNVEVSLDSSTSSRFGDYLNSIPLPARISVFKAD